MSDFLAPPSDDVSPDYLARRQASAIDDVIERARARQPAPAAGPAASRAAPAEPGAPAADGGGPGLRASLSDLGPSDVARAVVRNAGEMPLQAVGGVSDAVHNTFSALDSFAWWLEDRMPLGTMEGFNPLAAIAGPDDRVKQPETPAGALTRDMSRFLTGFVPLLRGGRAAGAAAGATSGAPKLAAEAASAVTAGAVTDFFTRSPQEDNLANLLRDHEILRGPVVDYLAADPADGEAEARFKKGLEGLGMGLLTDGAFAAIKAVKLARAGGSNIDRAAADLAEQRAQYGSVNAERDFLILGDPRAPLLQTRAAPQLGALASAQRTAKLAGAEKLAELGVPTDWAAKGFVKTGDVGGEEVYINFARIDTPDDIKKAIGQMADAFAPSIDRARRGVQSNAETAKLADELGLTVGDLLARRKGQPFNAEEALAARRLWAASAEKLMQAAEKAAAANAGPVDQYNFRRMMAVHAAIQAEVVAARTETARALQSWSIPAGSGIEQARAIQQMLDGMGGPDVSRALAQRLAALKAQGADMAALNRAIRKGAFARSMDAVKEIYINALLSSPTTHIVNVASNGMVAWQQVFERGAAELIGSEVAAGEAAAMTFGLVTGLKDAFRLGYKAAKDGTSGAALGKIDAPMDPAVSARAFDLNAAGPAGRAVDFIGTVFRVPTRLLGAEDEFFKSIGYRMEVYAQAWRQAAGEGLQGREAGERVARLVADPPEHIRLAAADAALYATFTNQPGKFAQSLLNLRNSNSAMLFVLPFVRTPANIMTYAFERSPLAPLVGRWRADLAAGGARADLAMARMATGSATMAIAFDLAEGGALTGRGPDDPGEREALVRQGWQPYSIRVGDRLYSYQRSDPLGMTLGLAADMAELVRRSDIEPDEVDEVNELLAATIASIANTAISKTYLQGVAELVEMLADPGRYSESWINDFVAGFVPAGLGAVARAGDPGLKETMTLLDAVQQKLPGLRAKLPPARDLWGQERRPAEIYGRAFEILSPVKVAAAKPSPIDAEIQRLNLDLRRISKKLNWDGGDVNLKDFPKVYDAYTRLAGNGLKHPAWGLGAKDLLDAVVAGKHDLSEVYALKSDGEDGGKAVFIRGVIAEYRALARRQILADPAFADFAGWLRAAQDDARARNLPAEAGAPGAPPSGAQPAGARPVLR
jgi:hypothetical protein